MVNFQRYFQSKYEFCKIFEGTRLLNIHLRELGVLAWAHAISGPGRTRQETISSHLKKFRFYPGGIGQWSYRTQRKYSKLYEVTAMGQVTPYWINYCDINVILLQQHVHEILSLSMFQLFKTSWHKYLICNIIYNFIIWSLNNYCT